MTSKRPTEPRRSLNESRAEFEVRLIQSRSHPSAPRVTFRDVVAMCVRSAEFVAHLERLTGEAFAFTRLRSPMDVLVDESSGRDAVEMARFVVLVDELVWSRLPPTEEGT